MFQDDFISTFAKKKCQYCGAHNIKMIGSAQPDRDYKCLTCELKWRSVEYFRFRNFRIVELPNNGSCPYCKAPGPKIMRTKKPKRLYRCRRCGFRWFSIEYFMPNGTGTDNVKAPNKGVCPICGSTRIRIRRTLKPYRFYNCKDCEKNFKGLEIFNVRTEKGRYFSRRPLDLT